MAAGRLPRLGALVSLLALVVSSGCGKSEAPVLPPPTVVVRAVEQKDVPIYHEWVGQTRGAADVKVRARVQGIVFGIHFKEGGLVKKGQLLYTIDPAEYQEKVAAQEAALAQAQTLLARAQSDLDRYKPLAAMNAVSRRDLDSAQAERDAAAEQVDGAKAMLRVAKINLSYTRVEAPISGVIGISKVKVGDYVNPIVANAVLDTISNVDPIHVRFFVSEPEYLEFARRFGEPGAQKPEGKTALQLILADGSVHPERGHLVTVDRGLDPTTGALAIEAEFPNPGGLVRPGQFAKVRAAVDTRRQALLVPQRAVQELQGRNHVFVLGKDGTVELKQVTMGPRVGSDWVVDEGLAPGDTVVVEGGQRIRSGMKVAPKEAAAPTQGE